MIGRISRVMACVCLLVSMTGMAAESGIESATDKLAQAVRDGTIKLSFRYRFGYMDDGGFDDNAYASTLRTRLSFVPRLNEDWSFLVEFNDVQHVGNDTFNDTRNGKTERPVEPDPRGTDLNQALVRYSGIRNTDIIFGRQRINRFGQRYVGGVDWRQNEQTFDSISAAYGTEGPLRVFYSYVFQVNRVFGPEKGTPARELDSKTHLLDAAYSFNQAVNLGGYVYLMDLEADSFSNATVGIRLNGKIPVGEDWKFGYMAEFARQQDYGDNPVSYDADYYWLEANADWRRFGAAIGIEVLGGGDVAGSGFRTPLATLHKFQGWADRFVGVGGTGLQSGIEDFYVGATARLLGGKFLVRYHDFKAQKGSGTLGTEWDASAQWSFARYYGLLLKMASYDAEDFSVNSTRFWVQMLASF